MSIHLFFNKITTFINAQFTVISKFLDACKIDSSDRSFSYSSVAYTWAIIGRKSLYTEVFLQNLEIDGDHLVSGQKNM